jgi:hypothetical protein
MNSDVANELLALHKTANENATASNRVLDLLLLYGLEDTAGGTLAILNSGGLVDISGEWQTPVAGGMVLNDQTLTVTNVTGTKGKIVGAYILSSKALQAEGVLGNPSLVDIVETAIQGGSNQYGIVVNLNDQDVENGDLAKVKDITINLN